MNVLVYCPGADTAGVGIGIQRAFANHSDWTVRQVRRKRRTYDYPYDAEWAQRESFLRAADVVHVMEEPRAIPDKPSVLHHHGTYLRKYLTATLKAQKDRGALGIVSTLDLHVLTGMEWIPAPYDIDWLATFRDPQPVLTIAHAGTNGESKSTGPFLAACERLAKEVPIRVLHINSMTWAECLRLKGQADIYFDQVLTGYGNNAVEAWGMGIPVIAGIEPAEARKRGHLIPDATPDEMTRRFDGLPFVRADEGSIYDALRLLVDPDERAKWALRGLTHAYRFHDQPVVVRLLEEVYRRALS